MDSESNLFYLCINNSFSLISNSWFKLDILSFN